MKIVSDTGLNLPTSLSSADFLPWQTAEDLSKFMQLELEEHIPMYNELVKSLSESGDEITMKQLKSKIMLLLQGKMEQVSQHYWMHFSMF